MTNRLLIKAWAVAGGLLVVLTGGVAIWHPRLALDLFIGGVWNLASLWCLAQLLSAWLGPQPSQRRAIAWLLVKFPGLYVLAFMLIWKQLVAPVGFGVGFTMVLVMLVGWYIANLPRLIAPSVTRAHGR